LGGRERKRNLEMTRSEEALQRRAKKRNLSVEDMKEIEASSFNKKKKTETTTTTISIPPKQKQPSVTKEIIKKSTPVAVSGGSQQKSGDRWVCGACNNSNLCRISTTHCNRCQRLRSEVVTQEKKTLVSVESVVVPSNEKNSSEKKSQETVTISKSTKPKKKKEKKKKTESAWTCPPATQEKIEENMKLRTLYENPETRDQLSPEELERARVLVERSERKKNKKATKVIKNSDNSTVGST
jgi:hypothetical protein